MESENTNEKKKQKIAILIGLVTLLLAVLGATYAYFQINTNNESSNTNITGKTPPKSLVTLKQGTSNLHLNISASDMSYENRTKEYYGTDDDQPYVGTEDLGTKTIATVELTGEEETTKYSCTAKLTVSKVTDPEEEADTMIDVLHSGDMILQFKGNIISNKLDLSELKTTGSKEYNLKFNISGSTSEEIKAYIKLVNKEEQQNYLAGKKLNIDISTSDLKCNLAIVDTTVAQLRYEDIQGYLSEELQGGMYRYQALFPDSDSSEMTNWICFGTTNKEECTDETDSDDNSIPDGIDKYMYRIIGITDEGQLYLLKETFLKEKDTIKFNWHKYTSSPACDGDNCEWPNVDLFKRINGRSNGTSTGSSGDTNLFLGTIEHPSSYEYLTEGTDWYNLIEEHNWMYGDTNNNTNTDSIIYNGNEMYAIETGKVSTKRIWPDSMQSGCWESSPCAEKDYTWSKSVSAKIGLMYMHDIDYAYTEGKSVSWVNVSNSWIHSRKDGYNTSTYELLITRIGYTDASSNYIRVWALDSGGVYRNNASLSSSFAARPVFYLSSKAKIASGNGTKSNPYILDVQE